MSTKRKYLELLNLPYNSTKEDIRKQYRKLAKEFHPDKNKAKNATEIFQGIKEAYDYLMEVRLEETYIPVENTPNEEFKRMERIRKAKERLHAQRVAEEKKLKESYEKLTSGIQWKIFYLISILSLITAFILLLEPILPKKIEKQTVTHFSTPYNGFTQDEVFLIQTDKKKTLFCQQTLHKKILLNDTIYIESSFIFHNPTKILHRSKLLISEHEVDFSIPNLYPFVTFLFAVPYFVSRKRKLTTGYIFLYKFSFYVVEGLFIFFIFTQNRWFHFLTLGFL